MEEPFNALEMWIILGGFGFALTTTLVLVLLLNDEHDAPIFKYVIRAWVISFVVLLLSSIGLHFTQ